MDSLGDRMKSYEKDIRLHDGAVIIRVDGKSFHTWTKKTQAYRPFDIGIHDSMVLAAHRVAKEMQGFKLAYVQSDEATFCLMKSEVSAGWFDYKTQKLASLAASMFTYYFNEGFVEDRTNDWHYRPVFPAFFDARALNVPLDEAANNFVWRQKDWKRNSVRMLGRQYFSVKEMHKVTNKELLEKLEDKGVDWYGLPAWQKYGTFLSQNSRHSKELNYYEINDLLGIQNVVCVQSE